MTGNDGGGGGQADAGGGAGEMKGRGARHEGPVEMVRSRFGIADGRRAGRGRNVRGDAQHPCRLRVGINYFISKTQFPIWLE